MKHLMVIPLLLCCALGRGQSVTDIQLDGTGKISPVLPERLGRTDKIRFKITDPAESFDQYKNVYVAQMKKAAARLAVLLNDKEKMALLETVYGIKKEDIEQVVNEIRQAITTPLPDKPYVYIPAFKPLDEKYFSVDLINTDTPAHVDLAPNLPGTPHVVTPLNTDIRFGFKVQKTHPYKKLVFDWLKGTQSDYAALVDPAAILAFRKAVKSLSATIEPFAQSSKATIDHLLADKSSGMKEAALLKQYQGDLEDIIRQCDGFMEDINALQTNSAGAVDLHAKRAWVLKWLWYQNSLMPALNPLGFGEGFAGPPDTTELFALRIKLQVRENFLRANQDKLKPDELDALLILIVNLKKDIQSIEKAAALYDKQEKVKKDNEQVFRTTSYELNNGVLFVDDAKKSYTWMRHHNAASNYELINDKETDEYLETDRVIMLAHNLLVNQRASLHVTFQDITNDASLLSDALIPVIQQLEKAITTTGSGSEQLTDKLLAQAMTSLKRLIQKLEALQANYRAIDYLLQQSNPPLEIEERTEKSMAYHSEVTNPVKKEKGPRKATYYLNTVVLNAQGGDSAKLDKVPTDTFSYRINKLYRLFPMAGIAWVPQRFATVTQDAEGKFSIDEEAAVKFVVGLKVYLRKTDIRSSQFFTAKGRDGKRLLLSRTSLTVAFDTKKPLDNIYTGLGFDLWPGFCLNLGGVFNRYNYKTYKNGQVYQDKHPYRGGFYMGLSTDLTLFAELGKFLNF